MNFDLRDRLQRVSTDMHVRALELAKDPKAQASNGDVATLMQASAIQMEALLTISDTILAMK